ncbi:hypothetical protein AB5I41_02350 [Sphingomonas sp. MMS24-JH45]
MTGPIAENLAFRLDGVYVKRDGFYNDRANNTSVNDHDRYFGRAQLLFEPTDDISFRLIGDYTKRNETCCAATYVSPTMNEAIGNLVTPVASVNAGVAAGANGNNIINVLRDLGQNLGAFNQNYSRDISVTPGRTYGGDMKDWGVWASSTGTSAA